MEVKEFYEECKFQIRLGGNYKDRIRKSRDLQVLKLQYDNMDEVIQKAIDAYEPENRLRYLIRSALHNNTDGLRRLYQTWEYTPKEILEDTNELINRVKFAVSTWDQKLYEELLKGGGKEALEATIIEEIKWLRAKIKREQFDSNDLTGQTRNLTEHIIYNLMAGERRESLYLIFKMQEQNRQLVEKYKFKHSEENLKLLVSKTLEEMKKGV